MLSLWPFLFVVLGLLDPVIDAGPARNTFTEERLGQRTSWDLDHNKAVSTTPRDHYVRRFGNSPIESRTTLSRRESMLSSRLAYHHKPLDGLRSIIKQYIKSIQHVRRHQIQNKPKVWPFSTSKKRILFLWIPQSDFSISGRGRTLGVHRHIHQDHGDQS